MLAESYINLRSFLQVVKNTCEEYRFAILEELEVKGRYKYVRLCINKNGKSEEEIIDKSKVLLQN